MDGLVSVSGGGLVGGPVLVGRPVVTVRGGTSG
jgi:hypothetical protein